MGDLLQERLSDSGEWMICQLNPRCGKILGEEVCGSSGERGIFFWSLGNKRAMRALFARVEMIDVIVDLEQGTASATFRSHP